MKKKALLIIDNDHRDGESEQIEDKLKDLTEWLDIRVLFRSERISLDSVADSFFSRPSSADLEERGWSLVGEGKEYDFLILYVDMEFASEHSLEELWSERIEKYICSSELDSEEIWKLFCGNSHSGKRIYITPKRKDNLGAIKSIFRIFLHKQMDNIREKDKRDVEIRYYLTTQRLPFRSTDSSERLIPACSSIYKLAESLKKDKLYLSSDVMELLPPNIRNSLKETREDGDLYSYSFNLLT
ncbi:MAG: hypothetical protein JXR86_03295 [Spirochaetales bacterium]|nr:hypothetical protein [Spirochaetales bacterium]